VLPRVAHISKSSGTVKKYVLSTGKAVEPKNTAKSKKSKPNLPPDIVMTQFSLMEHYQLICSGQIKMESPPRHIAWSSAKDIKLPEGTSGKVQKVITEYTNRLFKIYHHARQVSKKSKSNFNPSSLIPMLAVTNWQPKASLLIDPMHNQPTKLIEILDNSKFNLKDNGLAESDNFTLVDVHPKNELQIGGKGLVNKPIAYYKKEKMLEKAIKSHSPTLEDAKYVFRFTGKRLLALDMVNNLDLSRVSSRPMPASEETLYNDPISTGLRNDFQSAKNIELELSTYLIKNGLHSLVEHISLFDSEITMEFAITTSNILELEQISPYLHVIIDLIGFQHPISAKIFNDVGKQTINS
jgi:hypothetical protein